MRKKVNRILKEIRPELEFFGVNNFFDDEMLDSFDMITLVADLEKEFNVKIDGTDIVAENFCNFEAIERLLHKSGAK